MIDDHGRQVKEAGPSVPVEVLGLSGVPSAGDPFTVVENEARAREVAAYRQSVLDKKRTTSAPVEPREHVRARVRTTRRVEFPLVIKADVQGSVEAIVSALNQLSTDEIKVRVLHSGVGAHHRERRDPGQRRAARRSSASTSAPTPRRARSPTATRSSSAIMTSSITSPTG